MAFPLHHGSKFQSFLVLLAFSLGLPVLACGGEEDQPTEPSAQVTTIEVTPTSAEFDALGATRDFQATVRDQDGDVMPDIDVSWSVDPDSVASFTADGTVTAEAPGSAVVEASASGVTGTADLSVRQEVATLQVSPDSAELNALGATRGFEASAEDENGYPVLAAEPTWSVEPDSVAAVGEDGTATAESNGAAAVVAEASDVADTATLVVNQEVASLEVTPDSVRSEATGTMIEFEATARDRNDHEVRGAELSWSSSDTTVAVVDGDGIATTKGQGTAAVTASAANVEGSGQLVVRFPSDRLVEDFAGPTEVHHPAKLDLAASPERVLVGNTGFGFTLYSKSGSELDYAANYEILPNVEDLGATKPRIVFDSDSERFFAVGEDQGKGGPGSEDTPGRFFLLVSTGPNPPDFSLEHWHRFVFETENDASKEVEVSPLDPRLVVTPDVVVLQAKLGPIPLSRDYGCFHRFVLLDKEEVLEGEISYEAEIDMERGENSKGCGGSRLQSVKRSETLPLFVSGVQPSSEGCGLEVWGIEDPLDSPSITRTEVTGAPEAIGAFCGNDLPNASQPDGAPDLGIYPHFGIRAQPILQGSDLWAAGMQRVETDAGDRSGVRWFQLDVGDWPTSVRVVKSGLFYSEHWALYPAIAANDAGDFAVVYSRSSDQEYPSVYYRYADGAWPGDSISQPHLLREGTESLTSAGMWHGGIRYGDYFGTFPDPTDRGLWIVGEYALDHETWGAWVGKVGF